jgi:hypothetical protein
MTITREEARDYLKFIRNEYADKRTATAALDLAIAALGGGWRPIEEAPRDGRIIGWNKLDGVLVFEPYNYGSNGQFEGWVVPGDSDDMFDFPTHFHPLPPSPQGETK